MDSIPAREIVEDIWENVFNFNFPVWEGGKEEISKAILNHYYMREIAVETVGFWKQSMFIRLNLIMPYYLKLYEQEMNMGNIFSTIDIRETRGKVGSDNYTDINNGTENTSSNSDTQTLKDDLQTTTNSENSALHRDSNDKARLRHSSTPQNGLTDVEEGRYLTDAEVNDSSSIMDDSREGGFSGRFVQDYNDSVLESLNGNREMNGKLIHDRDYNEDITTNKSGFQGIKPEVLKIYRENLINIISMIVTEVSDLFYGILG